MAAVAETSGLRSLESANSAVNSAVDEDDDDLEMLRSAALMSMKAKRKVEFDIPIEAPAASQSYSRFQHAKRNTGTGKFSWNQHARPNLIVIQPVPLEGEQVQYVNTNSNSRTDSKKCADEVKLLLPQHKWCLPSSDESSSPQTATARRVSGKFSHFESSDSDSEDSGDEDFVRSASPSSRTSNDSEQSEAEVDSGAIADPRQDDNRASPTTDSCNDTESCLVPSPVPNEFMKEVDKVCEFSADDAKTECTALIRDPANAKKSDGFSNKCKLGLPSDADTDRCHLERKDKSQNATKIDLSLRRDSIDTLEARRRKFESNVPIQPVSRKIVLLKGSKGGNCDTSKGDTGIRNKGWERDRCSSEKSPPPALKSVLSVVRMSGDDGHRDIVLMDEGRRKQRLQGRTVEIIKNDQEPLCIDNSDRKKMPVRLRLGQVLSSSALSKSKRKSLLKETSGSKRAKTLTSQEPPHRRKDRPHHSRRKREPTSSS